MDPHFNLRRLKGKTIKRIHRRRVDANSGERALSIDAIEFTDGSVLRFTVIETEGGDYGLAGTYPARGIEK